MALTLSNSGITSGSVIRAAEISQSIDAFTGTEAYDITLSGSFTEIGEVNITGNITSSANISSSGNLYIDRVYAINAVSASNVFLPGGGRISFDDTAINDQFIEGTDNNITITGDQNINYRAAEKNKFQNLGGSTKVLISSSGYISASGDLTIKGFSSVSASLAGAISAGGVPGGSDTEVQFNNAGVFGASANFTFDGNNVTATGYTGSLEAINAKIENSTLSTASFFNGGYVIENVGGTLTFNKSEGGVYTKFFGFDGSTELILDDSLTEFKTPRLKISGSSGVFGSTIDISGSISASDANGTLRISGNDIYSNRPNRMYIGNESANANASLMFVVGGEGTAANSAININSNQEVMFGNPATAYQYPLGFVGGELGSYGAFMNNSAPSSSLVSIMGDTISNNSDGILFIGANANNGGGLSFKGDGTSPFGNLDELNEDVLEIYRQDVSTNIAYPMMSFPPDQNHINITLGTVRNDDNQPEMLQLSAKPQFSNPLFPYRRIYPIVQKAIDAGNVGSFIAVPMEVAGTYRVTWDLLGHATSNIAQSFVLQEVEAWYNSSGGGGTPAQEGTTTTVVSILDTNISLNVSPIGQTDSVLLRVANNGASQITIGGYCNVDYLPTFA
jgi:hypothetical protein